MANISSASGTIQLKGSWSGEAIEAVDPLVQAWEFHGAYGIMTEGHFTPGTTSLSFTGSGRWSMSSSFEDFHAWTKDWIKNGDGHHPLSEAQYKNVLKLMHENDLSIWVDFEDREEGVGYELHELGRFTSNGRELKYTQLSCESVDSNLIEDGEGYPEGWRKAGDRCFDWVVCFFRRLVPEVEEQTLRSWVLNNIEPDTRMGYNPEYRVEQDPGMLSDELNAFAERFDPKGEDWEYWVEKLAEDWDVFVGPTKESRVALRDRICAERRFWNFHDDSELHPDWDTGELEYSADSACCWVKRSAVMARSPELVAKYGLRSRFPYYISRWKDVGSIHVGLDSILRIDRSGHSCVAEFPDGHNEPVRCGESAVRNGCIGMETGVAVLEDGKMAHTNSWLTGGIQKELERQDKAVAAAFTLTYMAVLQRDGTVSFQGSRKPGKEKLEEWKGIRRISAFLNMIVGVREDGTVILFGRPYARKKPELDVSDWTGMEDAQTNGNIVVGLTGDGRVRVTGDAEAAAGTADWTGITQIAVGAAHILGLRRDGTVAAWGRGLGSECDTDSWQQVRSIAAGLCFSFGVREDGSVLFTGEHVAWEPLCRKGSYELMPAPDTGEPEVMDWDYPSKEELVLTRELEKSFWNGHC